MIEALLPTDVSVGFASVLAIASFFTSALTAAFGIGGGVALLAIMATGMPVATVIPVHGVVQFGSNAGRAAVQRAHIDWVLTAWFCGGGLIGALVGAVTVTNLPDGPMKIAIAAFILFMVWGPKPRGLGSSNLAMAAGGALGGALTMFFGATGPFTAAFLRARGLDRLAQVATFSTCMSVQHVLKVVIFGMLGFAFADWIPLMAVMIATGFLGTLAGTAVLKRLPEKAFMIGLTLLLTAMALLLAWQGMQLIARHV